MREREIEREREIRCGDSLCLGRDFSHNMATTTTAVASCTGKQYFDESVRTPTVCLEKNGRRGHFTLPRELHGRVVCDFPVFFNFRPCTCILTGAEQFRMPRFQTKPFFSLNVLNLELSAKHVFRVVNTTRVSRRAIWHRRMVLLNFMQKRPYLLRSRVVQMGAVW